MHTEADLFLCCWDTVKHTLTFANKIHACCSAERQQWVVLFNELQTLKEDSASKKHKKPMCLYTHIYMHTHSHTHTCTHTPYIISAHILIPVWTILFTLLWLQHQHLPGAASSRHTFLWFHGWKRCSHFTSLLMDVLTSASLSNSQWAARLCEESGNDEKCPQWVWLD